MGLLSFTVGFTKKSTVCCVTDEMGQLSAAAVQHSHRLIGNTCHQHQHLLQQHQKHQHISDAIRFTLSTLMGWVKSEVHRLGSGTVCK